MSKRPIVFPIIKQSTDGAVVLKSVAGGGYCHLSTIGGDCARDSGEVCESFAGLIPSVEYASEGNEPQFWSVCRNRRLLPKVREYNELKDIKVVGMSEDEETFFVSIRDGDELKAALEEEEK